MSSKKIDKVIQVESIADLKSFTLTNYINFVRRSGGQLFQHYSLLDSYSEYLGYGNSSDSSSGYRETEVSFSREIYKKRVLSSVVLPLYMEDFSSNDFSFNGSKTETGADRNYFQVRLTPSWFDRHLNNFAMTGGELRNVYKRAKQSEDSFLNTGMIMTGGEFRLPLLRYRHETPDSVLTGDIMLSGGELRKILIKAKAPVESIESKEITFLGLYTSTNREHDIIEVDFGSIASPEDSPKTSSGVLDDFSTVEDTTEFVKAPGEPLDDGDKSIRILNKKGGVKVDIPSDSVEISPSSDWTLGINGMPRELSPGASLISVPGFISVTLDEADPSKLNIKVTPTLNIKTESGTVGLNKWVNVSIESMGGIIHVFVDGVLVGVAEEPLPLTTKIFTKGSSIYVGNDSSKTNGFIGNVDRLVIIKNLAVNASKANPQDPPKVLKREILASELSLSPSGEVGDKVEGMTWNYFSKPGFNTITKGIVFEASQYLVANNAADMSIYNFNNYKIEMVFYANTLPSLNYPLRTLIHKTGQVGDGDSSYTAGYHLSLASVDDSVKVVFRLANVSLYSSRSISIKTPYKIEIFKYNKYLMMFINDVFENLVSFNNNLAEDPLSDILIGRYRTKPSYDFQGEIYSWKFINYYEDKSEESEKNNLLKRYLPENTSNTVVLNFERALYDEGDPRRDWNFGDNLVADEYYLDKSNPRFGAVALNLNENTKFISLRREPVFDLKNEDFTIETWAYLTQDNTFSTIVSNRVSKNSLNKAMYRGLNIDSDGKVTFEGSKDSTGLTNDTILKSTARVLLNSWTHIALVKSGTSLIFYINGVKSGSVVVPSLYVDLSVEGTSIGSGSWNSEVGSQFHGNLDSFRLTKSKALYEGDSFPLPTKPFGNIDTGRIMDLSFDKKIPVQKPTEILLNFDKVPEPESIKAGVINSRSLHEKGLIDLNTVNINFDDGFKLEGAGAPGLVVSGARASDISQSTSKFGSSSFKGGSSAGFYINNEFFNFGLEDFSLDFWTFRTSIPSNTYEIYFSSRESPKRWAGVVAGGKIFRVSLEGTAETALALTWDNDDVRRPLNAWAHIALSRKEGVFKLFLNGKLMDEKHLPTQKYNLNSGGGFFIGHSAWTGSEYFRGYLDAMRVSKGSSLFNSEFNPDLLEAPSSSNRFYKNNLVVFRPEDVARTTENILFGDSSIQFKGTGGLRTFEGDIFSAPVYAEDDFTLELDARFEENYTPKFQTIFTTEVKVGVSFFCLFKYGNNDEIPLELRNKLALTLNTDYSNPILISDIRLENSRWYNITLTRYKGTLKLFLDGILNTRKLSPNLVFNFNSAALLVGSDQGNLSTLKGNIESLRFTPGISLYKNSFQTPNKYFSREESSEFFNLNYSDFKILEEGSRSLYPDLREGDAAITSEDGKEFLRTHLAATGKGYKGTYIPKNDPILNLGLKDFTIEYSFRVFIDKSFNAFQRDTSSPTYFSQVTDTYSRPTLKNAVTFESSNSKVSLKSPPGSYTVGSWTSVSITRTSGVFRLYLNGVLQAEQTVQENINLGAYDLYIAGGSTATEMDIDYFYINNGKAIEPQTPLRRPVINRTGFEDRFELLASTAENMIPDKTYFENNSLDQEEFVSLTDSEKVFKLAAHFKGNSYLKMDNFPILPRAFVLDFWVYPEKRVDVTQEVTIFKVGQSESDPDKGLTIKILADNYLYVNIKSENQATAFVLTDRQILEEEWSSIKLIFKDGLLDVYLNGNITGYYQNRNPSFFEGSIGKLFLGFDPTVLYSLPFKGFIDHVSFYKYTLKVPSGYRYYSTLQSLFKDSNKELFTLRVENGEVPNNLTGWKTTEGVIVAEAVEALANSKFFKGSEPATLSKMYQEIDISSYLLNTDLEIYVSWTQVKETVENPVSEGRVYIEYLDKFKNRLSKLESKSKPIISSVDYAESERFLIGTIPSHCKYLRVHVELLGDTGVRNIQIFTQSLGTEFYDRSRDIQEVFSELEVLPRTVASRYFSYDSKYESKNKEILVNSIDLPPLKVLEPKNTIYRDVSVEGVREDYSGNSNMVLRKQNEVLE